MPDYYQIESDRLLHNHRYEHTHEGAKTRARILSNLFDKMGTQRTQWWLYYSINTAERREKRYIYDK